MMAPARAPGAAWCRFDADSEVFLGLALGAVGGAVLLAVLGVVAGGAPRDAAGPVALEAVAAPPVAAREAAPERLHIVLLGEGDVPLHALAAAGALDAATAIEVASPAVGPAIHASATPAADGWLSVPSPADYRKGSGRPPLGRYQEQDASGMIGTAVDDAKESRLNDRIGARSPVGSRSAGVAASVTAPDGSSPWFEIETLPFPLDPGVWPLSAAAGPEN